MGFRDILDGLTGRLTRRGRKAKMPQRETRPFPTVMQLGQRPGDNKKYLYKPTPRNIRYFSHSPFGRRAINTIKNPISMLDWEITPMDGVDANSELKRQIETATTCLRHPNNDDNFASFVEQMVEDYLCGACAVEMQTSGDELRPLWMFPVDGLSIQIYPAWTSDKDGARYAQVVGYGTAFGGNVVAELRNDELMYIRPNGSSATPFGFGPLEIAFVTINNLLGTAEFTGRLASNQRPGILVDIGEGWSQRDLEQFRSYWQNEIEGQGKVPFTGVSQASRSDAKSQRGVEVHRLYPEGDDGMFLKYQEFLIRTLAAAFDISPQNLNIEADVNRNTSEVAEDRDWNQAIKPCAFKLQQHFTREVLHGKLGFSQLHFRFKGLEREDELALAQIYKLQYEGNAITPNEHREKMGEPPAENEWGDMTFADVQIAIQAAKGAGEVDDPALKGGKSKPKSKSKK